MKPMTFSAAFMAGTTSVLASSDKCVDARGNISLQQMPCAGKLVDQNDVPVMRGPALTQHAEFRGRPIALE